MHAELDLVALRIVVAGREPMTVLLEKSVGQRRKDFLRWINRQIGFFDAGDSGLADIEY